MSAWTGEDKRKFYHIGRGAELVVVKDRDVVAFIPEATSFGATSGMTITKEGTTVLWESSPAVTCEESERLLLWSRISGTNLSSSFRWVPYTVSNDMDSKAILPLREVYAPKLSYDRSSNTLSLWFWTNVLVDSNTDVYSEANIYPLKFTGYKTVRGDDDVDPPTDPLVKRVLCFAVGQFVHAHVSGGFVGGFVGQTTTNTGYDLIPLFSRPVIISNFAPATTDLNPGLVTDGWYGGADEGGEDDPFKPKPKTDEQGDYLDIPPLIVFVNQKPYTSPDFVVPPVGHGDITDWPAGSKWRVTRGVKNVAWIMVTLSVDGTYSHVVTFEQDVAAFPPFASSPPSNKVWQAFSYWDGDMLHAAQIFCVGQLAFYAP